MRSDNIVHVGLSSLIQHGKLGDRIYVMKLHPDDKDAVLKTINDLIHEFHYGKVFLKAPDMLVPAFLADNYRIEGHIPGFYRGEVDGFFLAKFPDPKRAEVSDTSKLLELEKNLTAATGKITAPVLPDSYGISVLDKSHANDMAVIFKDVFESYPFPIHNPDYLKETMDHILYCGIFYRDRLIAVSSAETDSEALNAEMTDFAVPEAYRGKKLSIILLHFMEQHMKRRGYKTAFTIARLNSLPMNRAFINQNYRYAGTLVNNTQIAGTIESMNVLYKRLYP